MSSLARISLRTTAAAAGIAAIGTGLAGQALAAEVPALPGADALTGAGLPAAPALPQLANVELPTVSTAGPELPALDAFEMPQLTGEAPALPDAAALPEAPEAGSLPDAEEEFDADAPSAPDAPDAPGEASELPSENGMGNDMGSGMTVEAPQGSALSGLDSAAMFLELAQETGALAG